MDTPQFIYRKQDGEPSSLSSISQTLGVAHIRIKVGQGPFRISLNGKTSRQRFRKGTFSYLRKVLGNASVGDHFRVYGRSGDLVFAAKCGQPAIQVIDTNGNDKTDACWSYEKSTYPNITYLGAYVCKDIAGTNEHSQHSYGNAVDCGAPSQAELERIAHDLVNNHAGDLNLENVIVSAKIWTFGSGWRPYTGDFHSHVHCDFRASINPSLPCGVRSSG